jgi:HTH-type transcriptional regulator/antitoxin HigA
MAKSFKPAEVFPPGEFIREELEERGWTQGEFARILGRPLQVINQIINGKKRITVETAKEIGLAFGTGPELWLNLENTYRLHTTAEPDQAIARRARERAA